MYTALKYVNEQGGIQATRIEDGIYVYLEPGTDEHDLAEGGAWGAIEALHVPTLAEIKAAKLNDLGSYRWAYERAGTTIGGTSMDTSETTRLALIGANEKARGNPAYTVNFKIAAGSWITLNALEIIALADGLADFVQACFDREKVLSDLIVAAVDEAEIDAIDITSGWP